MARFRVLPEVIDKFKVLASLDTDVVQGLCEILGGIKVQLSPEEAVADAIYSLEALEGLSDEDKDSLASSIIGLHVMRYGSGRKVSELTADVIEAAEGEPGFDFDRLSVFRANLEHVLGIPTLQGSMKAWTLIDEYDKVFLEAKVLSDIRPVFDDELKNPLRASLVLHTIKIIHRHNGRREPIFITADAEDLELLREQVERALEKDRALKKMIQVNATLGEALPGEEYE